MIPSEPEMKEPAAASAAEPTAAPQVAPPLAPSPETQKWRRLRNDGTALVKYLLDSEVHTFAFSVAANAILSFIPFIVLLYSLSSSYFHSKAMVNTVTEMVKYFMPSNQPFVAYQLWMVANHNRLEFFSLVMILVACTGIFLPLEVALNQAWGVVKSRNYLANQVVALGLAILMVVLGLLSIGLNAVVSTMLGDIFLGHDGMIGATGNALYGFLNWMVLAASTGVASILFFFSIYWLLPNRKVPWRPVLRTATIAGVVWLVSKYLFVNMLLPRLHLEELYGPFSVSVGLIFWSYTSGLILFAGAQFSVSKLGPNEPEHKS